MSMTRDADSLTNSLLMALEKESRKSGLAPEFHRDYAMHRQRVRSMVDRMLEKDVKEPEHA